MNERLRGIHIQDIEEPSVEEISFINTKEEFILGNEDTSINDVLFIDSLTRKRKRSIMIPSRTNNKNTIIEEDVDDEKIIIAGPNNNKIVVPSDNMIKKELSGMTDDLTYIALKNYTSNKRNFPVNITPEAFTKINDCAKAVTKVFSSYPEAYFHLLTHDGEQQNIITDVMFAHKQKVSNAFCEPTDRESDLAYMRNNGYSYAGWSHSHGAMNTFHSSTDDANIRHLLSSGSSIKKEISFPFFPEQSFTLYYTPSIVVNALDGMPYVEVGTRFENPISHRFEYNFFESMLFFEDSKYLPADYTFETLEKVILSEVTLRGDSSE